MTKHHRVLHRHAANLLSKPGVYAVGLGEKISGGKRTGKRALICSIAKKKPLAQLAQDELIPQDIEGIPTDIVEIGSRPRKFPAWQQKQRPVMPGISTGHYQITAGTIGAIVEVDGDVMLLSNNHVFANENEATLGDPILQPGPYDGGSAEDKVAELYNYIPVTFTNQDTPTPPPTEPPPAPTPPPPAPDPDPQPDPTPAPPPDDHENSKCPIANALAAIINMVPKLLGRETRLKAVRPKKAETQDLVVPQVIMNSVDCAVARIDSTINYQTNYLTFISGVKGVNELAGVGTKVKKMGRTTGFTEGEIKQTDVIVDVQYDGGICRFENQLWIESGVSGESFSAGGDSGSLILDDNDNAVGLLFAGNDVVTFANEIGNVMQELNITRFIGE